MKNIFAFIFVITSLTLNAQDMQSMKMPSASKKQPTKTVIYTCVMHPEIHALKPGNCPKCGMKLVVQTPVATKSKSSAPAKKAVAKKNMDGMKMPMPNPTQTDPKVVQPTNMDGMKMPATKPSSNQPAAVSYTCVMHPEIHSSKPGNCPKCGMKLVKEKSVSKPVNEMDKNMQMPVSSKKDEMNMNGMDMTSHKMMGNEMPNAQLGEIKTLVNKVPPRTVRYDLYVRDTMVTYGKKPKRAIAVNGQIPMPTLTFTEGDTAEIWVHNQLKEETSLHWHGLFLPNRMDGVPYLTQMPIKPGEKFLYKFPIVQHGTHWYHSHFSLQEQIGMYGSFIMNKRKEWDIPTIPVVLSEWIDMKPEEVHRSLRSATDWFAIQKGTTQSYTEAIKSGHFKTKVANEWKRMNAMDVSDVYYDNFLINGKNQNLNPQFKAGDKVRLRIANGGASDYFWLTYSGGKITVVATDGNDVSPVEVDRLIIAVSETYDVIVTIPENKSYEFLVTPEDRTKSASLWLGKGEKVSAVRLPKLKYFAGMKMMNEMMDMNGNMVEMKGMDMGNQVMDMNTVMYPEVTGFENPQDSAKYSKIQPKQTPVSKKMQMDHTTHDMAGMNMGNDDSDIVTLNYGMLRATEKTTLPKGSLRELKFDLTGNMNRYVWSLDNKTVSESDRILIKKGENLRIILFNNSMMRHPMHLHGHDFRVLNGQGEYAPMKNVIDIMPMERDTIEFAANEPGGNWFFHCHILYHMMSGMGRVFTYENSPPNPELPNPKLAERKLNADDRKFHPMGRVGLESNGSDGQIMLASTRFRVNTMWHLGLNAKMGYESETMVGRYIGRNQWLLPYVGFDYHYKKYNPKEKNIFGNDEKNMFGQQSNKNDRKTAVAGVAYTLPLLFVADARVDLDGRYRFQLGREDIPVSPRLRANLMMNTDKEYAAGLRYILTKYISLSTHYDSDMGLGGGLSITY